MAGLYLHIPFCRKACLYCDFHFVTSLKAKAEMVAAMVQELQLQRADWEYAAFETVYLGGGTPSVLDPDELNLLLDAVKDLYGIAPFAEITLEANPDDLTAGNLAAWKLAGVNRLSVGIQAFDESTLKWMNRSHRLADIESGIARARAAGFEAFNMDLIFGWPGLDAEKWESQLQKMVALGPDHISVYSLTVEEKTALAHQVKTKLVRLPSDEENTGQFLLAHTLLEAEGYMHYEISNYARPGAHSRHNSSYWQGIPYLGIGPSAHSYDGRRRWWNHANNAQYLKMLAQNQLPVADQEILSNRDRYHEYLMTGLRQSQGVSVSQIENTYFPGWEGHFGAKINTLIAEGLIEKTGNGHIRLTPRGWLTSDTLVSGFFISEE